MAQIVDFPIERARLPKEARAAGLSGSYIQHYRKVMAEQRAEIDAQSPPAMDYSQLFDESRERLVQVKELFAEGRTQAAYEVYLEDPLSSRVDYARFCELMEVVAGEPQPGREPEPHRPMPAYCDPANEFRGEKFERGLDTAEIAKRIRADIKAAKKAGEIPAAAKISVTIDRFSGGSAIRIRIRELPFNPYNPERIREEERTNRPGDGPIYSPEAEALIKQLEAMMNAYNRDNSDPMTDYFDVNFYGSVNLDWELSNQARAEILEN